jgi:hypothetical protein
VTPSTSTIIRTVPTPLARTSALSDIGTRTTRMRLACGMAAGPLFVVVALAQVLTRPGFDLTRQALSLLTLGSLGWIQSTNFILTGGLTIAGATALRRVLRSGPGSRWAPMLLGAVGIGLAAGGLFHPDPSGGFPPGTPANLSAVRSWHGIVHMVSGSVAFLSLIAVCFVLARRFARYGQRRWAICSSGAGAICAIGVASGGAPLGTLTLFIGVSIALIWVALAQALLIAELGTI